MRKFPIVVSLLVAAICAYAIKKVNGCELVGTMQSKNIVLLAGKGTDYNTLREVNDIVVNSLEYDDGKVAYMTENGKANYDYDSIETIIRHGKGVCYDYCNLFMLLALEKGIDPDAIRFVSDGENHTWILYYGGGEPMVIDPTFEDNDTGNFFLIPPDEFHRANYWYPYVLAEGRWWEVRQYCNYLRDLPYTDDKQNIKIAGLLGALSMETRRQYVWNK